MAQTSGNGRVGLAGEPRGNLHSGERTNGSGKPVSNKILLSISDEEYQTIRTHLEFVVIPQGLNLHQPPERLKFAYFLNRGLASIVVGTKGGRDVEAGMVGYEGLVGTGLAVGLDTSPLREVVQIEGDAFRIGAEELQHVLHTTLGLQMMLSRYAVLQGMQVAQTAACNRLHDLGQRLARWLLMAQDRVDGGTLPITHEFLAIMLGTDRPSMTLAAGELQRTEAIRYRRAAVEILNRKKLEAAACPCYRVVQQLNGELGLK
ncbi:MAG TPA: Crp/Fnr family transcriptional regulator [Candidatus Acidoferrum sp.]|nr:Crp/Fnr family transcriptional regulator [Candidatus Acidoferrum sp.]